MNDERIYSAAQLKEGDKIMWMGERRLMRAEIAKSHVNRQLVARLPLGTEIKLEALFNGTRDIRRDA